MDKQQAKRRKVLQAGLAAPVILTVRPSSATALASNRCLERDALKPTPQKLLCDTPDEWMRWKCQPFELTVPVNGKPTRLSGRKFIKSINGNAYYELDRYSPDTVTPKTCSYVPGAPGIIEHMPSTPSFKHCLVKINSSGTPCAYQWESYSGSNKCTNSCWASLRPK